MTVDKAKLRELAEAATGDHWSYDGSYVCPARIENGTTFVESWRSVADCNQPEDTKFIAAANPGSVLDLLDEIESWRGALAVAQQERDRLKEENEALAHLLKRFVDSEHDDAEDQNERHHYHGESQALLASMGGEFQEYSLIPYAALIAQRDKLDSLGRDAARFQFIANDAESSLERAYGDDWLAVVDSRIP